MENFPSLWPTEMHLVGKYTEESSTMTSFLGPGRKIGSRELSREARRWKTRDYKVIRPLFTLLVRGAVSRHHKHVGLEYVD